MASRYQKPTRPRRSTASSFAVPADSLPDFSAVAGSWGVVVPVKRLALAKTRLSAYGEDARQELALAFAADVVAAATQVARVLVVTDDDRAAAALSALGADVTPDDPDAGLNPALSHGADLIRARQPDSGVATLSADLPAVRPGDLRAVLSEVRDRAFVRDVAGTGTTLLAAGPGRDLGPCFGTGSGEAHAVSGAVEVSAPRGLRCDVDTREDLLSALALGAGARTRALAAELGIVVVAGTVRDWGEGGGTAYRDDGSVLHLPAEALQDSGIRFLRVGQRVRVAVDPTGTTRLALP
jgi:2-phospho-L-lactate guanylyltransferase